MDGNTIPIGENTTVVVKTSGDLFLEGQEANEVRFQSSEDRIRVNQSNETLYVETHASMDLSVPRTANVVIEKVGGSALIQDLESTLVIQKIGGDLSVRSLGAVRIEKVGGNLLVQDVRNGLTVHKVGGNLKAREVNGGLEFDSVGGNADLQVSLINNMEARAGGNFRLGILESISGRLGLRAGGDLELYLPPNTNGKFTILSGGESISVNLQHQNQAVVQEFDGRRYEFSLGEGDAVIEAQAGGDVRLNDETAQFMPLTEEFDRREEAWKEARERRGSPSWTGGFGFDRSSAWADMISRRAQEAARRAEQRAHAAMRRTEEQIRRAAERDIRWPEEWGGPAPHPGHPTPPTPKSNPVTEQERLIVLQMLQDGKIDVEQAEKLLAALEGRFDRS
jgi:hypothetical protein